MASEKTSKRKKKSDGLERGKKKNVSNIWKIYTMYKIYKYKKKKKTGEWSSE